VGTATTELQEEGYKLMGAAFEVYNEQGFGMAEEMRIARISVGYLVNFGHKGTLEWKRFILTDQKSSV